jgi:hypothetical protein
MPAAGIAAPTPVAKANAEAECPEGQDVELGISTWRVTGTSCVSRSGRRRLPSGLSTRLTTAEVSAIAARPFSVARRPRLPPNAARSAEQPSHNLELFAARESRRSATSIPGVGVAAIAA